MNYEKHSVVRLLYRFHMYYHVRQVLKRLEGALPFKSGYKTTNNPYSGEGFFKLCKEYGVPHNPMRYQNEEFFGTHQHRVSWITLLYDSLDH